MDNAKKTDDLLTSNQRKKVIDALILCLDDPDPKVKLRAVEKILLIEKQNTKSRYE